MSGRYDIESTARDTDLIHKGLCKCSMKNLARVLTSGYGVGDGKGSGVGSSIYPRGMGHGTNGASSFNVGELPKESSLMITIDNYNGGGYNMVYGMSISTSGKGSGCGSLSNNTGLYTVNSDKWYSIILPPELIVGRVHE